MGVRDQQVREVVGSNLTSARRNVAAPGAPALGPKPRVVIPIQLRTPGAPKRAPAIPASRSFGQQAVDQFLAGARGAQDAFTFGAGDYLYAGAGALGDWYREGDLRGAFDRRIAAERARDAYDAKHYGSARTVGQIAGTGAQFLVLGPAEAAVQGGVRMAEATPLIAREIAMLGGAGATGGVGGQVLSDASRGRVGSVGDYLGAAAGGSAGALAARSGMGRLAGAGDGAVTSVAQDVFNGRLPSLDRAREAFATGGALGTAGGLIGRRWTDTLGATRVNRRVTRQKELLGEHVSRIRTWARGDKTLDVPKSAEYLQGGKYTFPDQRTLGGQLVESKFGRTAELSKRQREAYQQLPNYRVDHTLPSDVGAFVGLPMAQIGSNPTRKRARP